MKQEFKTLFKSFSLEMLVYAVLVTGYFFAVLHFLGDWLNHLFHAERTIYALLSLVLIIGQGIVLEFLTRTLLRLIKPGREA